MIICCNCKNELKKEKEKYYCDKCHSEYKVINDVPYFYNYVDNDEYNFDDYSIEINKIANAEEKHFWFKSRRNLILQIFERFISKKAKIIEIGAGTGSIARMLTDYNYKVSIGEIHPNGIAYALKKNDKNLPIYQFNIMDNPFKNHFDVVGMFDVLEHIQNDKLAIKNIKHMLSDRGKIVLTVPAHMWLWCEEDKISNHFIRYEQNNLKQILIDEGFSIKYASNFFISILPLLYLRKKMKPSNNIKINPIINFILLLISNLENKILNFVTFKIGGSIIIVAEKNND